MDIILLIKGKCSFYYLDEGDGESFRDAVTNINQIDSDYIDSFFTYLTGAVEVAGCPKSLSESFYKKLTTPAKANIQLYEIKRNNRLRLICYEHVENKVIIIVKAFYKENKKKQDKLIKQFANNQMQDIRNAINDGDVVWNEDEELLNTSNNIQEE